MVLVIFRHVGRGDQHRGLARRGQFGQGHRPATGDHHVRRRHTPRHIVDVIPHPNAVTVKGHARRRECRFGLLVFALARRVDVLQSAVLVAAAKHLGHRFVDAACTETAADRQPERTLVQPQFPPCARTVGTLEALMDRITRHHDLRLGRQMLCRRFKEIMELSHSTAPAFLDLRIRIQIRFVPDFPVSQIPVMPVRPAFVVVTDDVFGNPCPFCEILRRMDVALDRSVLDGFAQTVDDVRAHAKREGLEIVVRDSVFDSDVAGGVVVDQLPKLSTKRTVTVKPGRKIYVTINAYNRRMVDVPYVAKQTLRQALNQLERAGLSVERLNYEPNLTSTDYVVRQSTEGREISPSTAAKVPYATGVTLGVTYRRDEQYTVVPRLVGMRLSQAKSTVWDRGLNIKEIVYDATVTDFKQRREAKVYKQSLHPNAGAQRGSELTLYLSCDMELVDSLTKISDRDARTYEKKRREEEAEREAQFATEEAETSEE